MKNQVLNIFVILVLFLCGAESQSENATSAHSFSVPVLAVVQKEPEKTPDTLVREKGAEDKYRVRVPPPFVEEFAGIPRSSRRVPGKTREIREVTPGVRVPTPSCGDHVKPCSCCCKSCWEFSFENLKLCFNACSSAHENCSCQKSQFYPLDFKKSGFLESVA